MSCCDEGGLPIHLPIGVNEEGSGPTEPDPPFAETCWCSDEQCYWKQSFRNERARGYAEGLRWAAYAATVEPLDTLTDLFMANADRAAP